MPTIALTSVDWICLTIGDRQIGVAPSLGVRLRLLGDAVPVDRGFGLLDPPRPAELRVAVDLIPTDAGAVHRCELEARRIATELEAHASPLGLLREFSLEAALSGDEVPYSRVSVPRLTLLPGEPPVLDEDQPVPSVRVFTATAHEVAPGRRAKMTYSS